MNAGLGDERTFAHIGRMPVRRAVEHVVERARRLHQGRKAILGHADLEGIGKFLLQLQRRDQRTEIGITAAFAETVQGTLDLPRAREHRRERIGNRLLGVVMRVNAEVIAGDVPGDNANDRLDLVRHGAAIGVTQDNPPCTGVIGGPGTGQRERWVFPVAVEEMFAVHHDLAASRRGGLHAVADRRQIFIVRGLERDPDLIGRGLCNKADRIRLGIDQRGQSRIVGGRPTRPSRHAESRETGMVKHRLLRKQLGVGWIGAGIAALDIVDAEIIKHLCNRLLVLQREVDAVGLRAVAQRRIEEIETFAAHAASPAARDFFIVVLASHSSSIVTEFRCVAT